ncbi:hypothetical protein F373_gp215 [Bacillus phage SP-10]|uniref:hypothetical protein n=1 Tax=Bacillus phage SP10 TaxID=941058 RepID=UPI0002198BAB|nr:hypothetical protein F373_gp215 [Bacillus phage SP-10]BAK53027.1 hypothetical protein [Bacillus phage SP-10]
MNYYEVSDPYYALIQSESKEEAEKIYDKNVAHVDDYKNFKDEEIREVSRDYALVRFAQTKNDAGELEPLERILEEFGNAEIPVLIWDGALV